jgi:hypothetical protein
MWHKMKTKKGERGRKSMVLNQIQTESTTLKRLRMNMFKLLLQPGSELGTWHG